MSNVTLEALFTAAASSTKLLKVEVNSWVRLHANHANYTITIPHGYTGDDLIVAGYVQTIDSGIPGEEYTFGFPYVDALGNNIVSPSWDSTNVYLEFTDPGTSVGDTTYNYTLIIGIV